MTHRSRVCAILFDVKSQDYESTARFWSETLGRAMEFDAQAKYTTLCGEIDYLVQNADPGREGMHIDIETDDVEAEVSRLENLGAKQRNRVEDWVVMLDPAGHPFCVVPVQSKNWPGDAIEWN